MRYFLSKAEYDRNADFYIYAVNDMINNMIFKLVAKYGAIRLEYLKSDINPFHNFLSMTTSYQWVQYQFVYRV